MPLEPDGLSLCYYPHISLRNTIHCCSEHFTNYVHSIHETKSFTITEQKSSIKFEQRKLLLRQNINRRQHCRFQSIHSQFYICIYLLYVTRTTCFGLSYFRPSSGPSITLLLAYIYCMSRGRHVSASLILGHLQVHRSLCSLQCKEQSDRWT